MRRLPVPARFIVVALIAAFLIVRAIPAPNYTDAYYHYNAATRLASGQGLTDAYLWNYIGAPSGLPAPSHLYWMPLTSITAALGMGLLNAPGDPGAAQILFVPMLATVACVGFWLGTRLGGSKTHGWYAGLLTLLSGLFAGFWGAIDTFTPYAFAGSLCLVALGLGVERHSSGWWALAGVCAALAHLTRADGVLLLIVGFAVLLWPWDKLSLSKRFVAIAIMSAAYLIVMAPWFIRNLGLVGSPLPVGGAQAMWFRTYDEIFSFPPASSPQTLFADGIGVFVQSRWLALTQNLGTFVVVEGWVILAPFMLVGLWQRRQVLLLRPFWLYALGLHLAMTFVFPFPGYRGGLFHSAAALVPWWAALGMVGLHSAIDWVARKRRRWNPRTAKPIFSAGILLLALALTIFGILRQQAKSGDASLLMAELDAKLPDDARLMVNDPAAIYYYTGRSSVVLPNEAPDVIEDIATIYDIDYLLIEFQTLADGSRVAAIPEPLRPMLDTPPPFLTPISLEYADARLYEIDHPAP